MGLMYQTPTLDQRVGCLMQYYLLKNSVNFITVLNHRDGLKRQYIDEITKQINILKSDYDIIELEKIMLQQENNIQTERDVICQIAITFCIINILQINQI